MTGSMRCSSTAPVSSLHVLAYMKDLEPLELNDARCIRGDVPSYMV